MRKFKWKNNLLNVVVQSNVLGTLPKINLQCVLTVVNDLGLTNHLNVKVPVPWKPLTIITKGSILDIAAVLDVCGDLEKIKKLIFKISQALQENTCAGVSFQ